MTAPRASLPLAVPTALGGALRLAHLLFLASRDPLFRQPVVDALWHAQQAREVLDHGVLLHGTGAFYKAPLLTYLYALLFAMFDAVPGLVAMRVINAALGTAAVWFAARVALRLGGPRAAWVAGLAAAVYGTAIYYDGTLLQPPLLAVLLLATVDRLLAAEDGDAPWRDLFIAGVLCGLLVLTRGEGLLVAAACASWAAARGRHGAWPALPGATAAVLVLVPVAALVAPVTARNALLERDPVVVSWNGGINLFMGNDPGFDQTSGNWNPDLAWMRLYRAPSELGQTRGADHQAFFLRQTRLRVMAHPLRTARLLAVKTALLLSGYEISNNQRIYDARSQSPVLALLLWRTGWIAVPFGLAAPLIAAGIAFGGGPLVRRAAPLLLVAGATAVIPVLFFNTARYRLPAILVLLPAAAAGFFSTPGGARRAAWGRAVGAALAVAAISAIGTAIVPARPSLPPSDTTDLADIARAEKRLDDELALRRRAVAEEPDSPLVRIRLADALLARGKPAEALGQYEAVLAMHDIAADWTNAATRSTARCYVDLGQYDRAITAYQAFLAADPDRPMTGSRPDFHLEGTPPLQACAIRLELARAFLRAGRTAEAVAEANRVALDCAESERLARAARQQLRDTPIVVP